MPLAVILEHNTPDGESHFDWLIDQPRICAEHRLLTFRCVHQPDLPDPQAFSAQRLPNHRAIYLTYQGPISHNRGTVHRLATGTVHSFEFTPKSIELTIVWENQTIQYQGTQDPDRPDQWLFDRRNAQTPLDE